MTTEPFSFAIIGAGGIAGAHANAIDSSDALQLVAVADTNDSVARAFGEPRSVPFFTDGGNLVEELADRIDGVIVCTPPSARLEIVRTCLEKGIAVLTEKPLSESTESGERLLELARANPETVTAIGFCHRYCPGVRRMRELANEGAIGRLTRFENTFATYFPALRERWMSDPSVSGGGSFIDTGSHSIDLFRFLVGDASVVGAVLDHDWAGRGESSASVLLRSTGDDEVAGVIQSGWSEPDRFTLTLVGTQGLLHYDYMHPTEISYRTVGGESHTLEVETHEVRFRDQLLAFARSVRDRRDPDLAGFDDGLAVNETVEAATTPPKLI